MAAKNKRGLGRGLRGLIKDETSGNAGGGATRGALEVPVESISKSQWQPRHVFDKVALAELADSIKEKGVLQPLLVRAKGKSYELIAGERRLKASASIGLQKVPVIVIDAADRDAAELALIENLQREDLNIIEEANGYNRLAEAFNLTQEDIAIKVGKPRATVANAMRLLSLPEDVKRLVSAGTISTGHAKVLMGLDLKKDQSLYAKRVLDEDLTVRKLEKLVQNAGREAKKPLSVDIDIPSDHLSSISDELHTHFATSVRVSPCRTFANGRKGKGTIEIDYFSSEDLTRILEVLGIDLDLE